MIDVGEVGAALLLTATRCKQVLCELVKRRFSLTDKQFNKLGWERQSLDCLKNMCSQTDVPVVCEYKQKLNKFAGKRNDLAHSHGYFEELQQNHDEERGSRRSSHRNFSLPIRSF